MPVVNQDDAVPVVNQDEGPVDPFGDRDAWAIGVMREAFKKIEGVPGHPHLSSGGKGQQLRLHFLSNRRCSATPTSLPEEESSWPATRAG